VASSTDGFQVEEIVVVRRLLVEREPMTSSADAMETSYQSCRRMCRRAGSSFYPAFLLLPREKRRAMEALYAFMRHTDDLADDLSSDCRREALGQWRAAVEQAIEGGAMASALLPALADAVRRFHIPGEHLLAVIDGVEMDLEPRRYETFAELETYCERVASAVGLACIHIWGFRGSEAFEPARQVGLAMQLTNILRDMKEDAAAGRVYLPLADLRECGYSVDDLMAGVDNAGFRRLVAKQAARAEEFYRQGSELIDWLEPSGRRIFGLMTATYQTLLRKIASQPGEILLGRVRLGRLRKLRLAARWAFLPPRKESLR
jgi:15-cis-phytoene synthase